MELRRFFVLPSDISGDEVILRGDEFAHMTRVLRMKKGSKSSFAPTTERKDFAP